MKLYHPYANRLLERYLRSGEHPMKQRFIAYINRIFNFRRIKTTTLYDFEMVLDLRDLIQNRMFFQKVWEPLLSEFVNQQLKEDDVFYDIGANVGYFALLAAKKKVQVYAFDPDPENILVIEQNKLINKLQNIFTYNFGLGNKNENLEFYRASLGNNGLSGFTSRNTVDNFPIPVYTIDSLVYEQSLLPKPTFIKIDTEGWEEKVLSGASQLLKMDPPRIIIFESDAVANQMEDDFDAIKTFLEHHHYTITTTLNDELGVNYVAEYNVAKA